MQPPDNNLEVGSWRTYIVARAAEDIREVGLLVRQWKRGRLRVGLCRKGHTSTVGVSATTAKRGQKLWVASGSVNVRVVKRRKLGAIQEGR